MTRISVRALWRLYKQIATERGDHDRRELDLMQDAFYGGARSVLQVLNHMLEQDDEEGAREAIRRAGCQVHTLTRAGARRKGH
jgi:hypothetical protein